MFDPDLFQVVQYHKITRGKKRHQRKSGHIIARKENAIDQSDEAALYANCQENSNIYTKDHVSNVLVSIRMLNPLVCVSIMYLVMGAGCGFNSTIVTVIGMSLQYTHRSVVL